MKTPKGILSKPSLVVVVMVGLTLGLTMPVQSTLIDRGLFDDGLGGMMKLIYDDDLGITWLGDANFGAGSAFDNGSSTADGRMTWGNAVNWAGSLTVGDFTDWRLPNAQNQDGSGPCTGNGCTDSEIGHVYFIELGNVGNTSGCTLGVNCGLVNTGPFSNLQADFYWSGTESAPVIVGGQLVFTAWFFNPFTGNQIRDALGGVGRGVPKRRTGRAAGGSLPPSAR